MSNWELAYKDYIDGMKYKDIAEKYQVSINTVKSWKSRKWNDMDEGATPNEKVAHKTKKVAHTKRTQPVIDNDDLTEQQKMFCVLYLRYKFNATKAYQEAYGVDYKTANSNAYRLVVNDGVNKEITRLKAELQQEIHVTTKDIIQEYVKQSFANMTDFVSFGNSTYTNDAGEENNYSFVALNESESVDGSLIQEVKQGRDGVSIKLHDKQKAMDALLKYLDVDGGTADSRVVFIDNEDAMRKELGEYDGTR